MNFKRAYHLFLIALMLLMQSAVIAHSVEHDSYEHTELCAAYHSAENSSALDISSTFILDRHFIVQAFSYTKQSYFSKPATAYASRAPPTQLITPL